MNTQRIWVTAPTKPFLTDFVEIEQLGNGQYGAVYRCQRKLDGKYFAVKYLNKNIYCSNNTMHDKYQRTLRDEIVNLRLLNHSNIIKMESIYEDNKMIYIVMEECVGGELFERIVKRGRYSEKNAKCIIKQILSALRYIHDDKGIIHCDLKPENILFLNKNEDSQLKLIDFGMSTYLPRLQYATKHCGTPYYIAPEIIEKHKYNHSCDVWSVGVILYIMIFGYPPFYVDPSKYDKKQERKALYNKIVQGFNAKIRNTDKYGYGPWFPDHIKTSKEVRDLISKLLIKEVNNRYTAKEALSHPWFRNYDDINSIIMSRLVGFNKNCQFKLVISTIFRNEFISKRYEDYEQLQELFNKYDRKKDGFLSIKEFENMINSMDYIYINKKYINKIYEQLTTSPIGITFNDLLNALVYDYLTSSDERLLAVFKKLDNNNIGQITIKRLKDLLKQIDCLGQWDKAINLIENDCIDPNGGIFWEEFEFKLHPNHQPQPEWIWDLFNKNKIASNCFKTKMIDDDNINDEVISN